MGTKVNRLIPKDDDDCDGKRPDPRKNIIVTSWPSADQFTVSRNWPTQPGAHISLCFVTGGTNAVEVKVFGFRSTNCNCKHLGRQSKEIHNLNGSIIGSNYEMICPRRLPHYYFRRCTCTETMMLCADKQQRTTTAVVDKGSVRPLSRAT